MEGIPNPKGSAKTVSSISLFVIGQLGPLGAAAKELVNNFFAKKAEESRVLLISAIEDRGIAALAELSEEQVEYLIPASLRFYEQVRLGEYRHNLKVLASFLADGLVQAPSPPDPGDVGKLSRQLEYLSVFDLSVLDGALGLRDRIPLEVNPNEPFISSEGLAHHYPQRFGSYENQIRASLAILSGRGFLFPDGAMTTGKSEEEYYLTDAARLIQHIISREVSPNANQS